MPAGQRRLVHRASSAADPEASPGARIGPRRADVDAARPRARSRSPGWHRALCEALAAGSMKSSKLLVVDMRVMLERGQPAFAVHAEPQRCRVGARWPTGPYIWSRRSTSLTGRPSMRAARMREDLRPDEDRLRAEAAAEERAARYARSPAGCRNRPAKPAPAPSPAPGSACRWSAGRRPIRRRWHAAPSRCGTAPASRRSASIRVRGRGKAGLDVAAIAASAGCRRRPPAASKRSPPSSPIRAGSRLVVRARAARAPSVAASSVSAITSAIGWLA